MGVSIKHDVDELVAALLTAPTQTVFAIPDASLLVYKHAAIEIAQRLWDTEQRFRESTPSHPCRIGREWWKAPVVLEDVSDITGKGGTCDS